MSWNLNHKIRQNMKEAEERNRSSHVDLNTHLLHQSFSQSVPMSNYEVTELTWENGQLAMHELGGMFPPPTSKSSSTQKPTWGGVSRANDTLESIVHQATYSVKQGSHPNPVLSAQNKKNAGSIVGSSIEKWIDNSGKVRNLTPPPPPPSQVLAKKRAHSESEHSRLLNDRESGCASASANGGFCRENNNDTTIMSWASYESDPRSGTRTKMTTDEDSLGGSENQEEDTEAKGETGRSYTARKGRAAAVHNQSERRRRDRINQKMKALQKLVPNASKTDKASMLDEVIEYLKQLQAQVQMMSNARFMPQMMMPAAALGVQQHLQQMSILARMGMGAGLGVGLGNLGHTSMTPQAMQQLMNPTQVASTPSVFVPPTAFVVPQMTAQQNPDPGTSSSASLQDQYAALLAQSMNMDLYNTMAAMQRQQQQQQIPSQSISNQLHSNHVQGV